MTNQTATTYWKIPNNINVNQPVDNEDHFFVDTSLARGSFSFNRLYKNLHLDPHSQSFRDAAPNRSYHLFLGHTGCGKSTELRRLRNELHDQNRFFVVFLDAEHELDINNLRGTGSV
jgi:hypothetical protein